ncbi:acyl carrier protein [Actinomadura macrotermitis]|uniref:Acyl carrier protein n=1 Tax=Actinomadura macrotermitis TaxID=2585200 RepID=A0A7K0C340_9ACTN|nr:acyl carrier protein [Actinomadura macrotermitis]MQY07861.1 Acyl carrier protein [Actinomadura macrotermitis]
MSQSNIGLLRVRVADIISEQFGVPRESITSESTLTDLGLDSLGLVELALTLEEEFNIPFAEELISMDKSFGRLLEMLETKGAAA